MFAAEFDVAPGRLGRIGAGVTIGSITGAAGLDADVVVVLGAADGLLPAPPTVDPLRQRQRPSRRRAVTTDTVGRPRPPPVPRRARQRAARRDHHVAAWRPPVVHRPPAVALARRGIAELPVDTVASHASAILRVPLPGARRRAPPPRPIGPRRRRRPGGDPRRARRRRARSGAAPARPHAAPTGSPSTTATSAGPASLRCSRTGVTDPAPDMDRLPARLLRAVRARRPSGRGARRRDHHHRRRSRLGAARGARRSSTARSSPATCRSPAPHGWGSPASPRLAELLVETCERYERVGPHRPSRHLGDPAAARSRSSSGTGSTHDSQWSIARRAEVIASEQRFGDDGAVTLALPDGRRLAVRGAIDRIDRTATGLVVTDHKTGRPDKYKPISREAPTAQCLRFQLPAYAAAALHLADAEPGDCAGPCRVRILQRRPVRPHRLRVRRRRLGPGRRRPRPRRRGHRGRLVPQRPAKPGYQHRVDCQYCQPDGLGTEERFPEWDRKRTDPRLARGSPTQPSPSRW